MLSSALLLLFATHTRLSSEAVPEAAKGATLLGGCQAEVRLMQRDTLQQAASPDLINGSYCVGYVSGFLAGLTPASSVCTHEQPMAAVVWAYVDYMEHNPQLLEEDKRVGLRLALEKAFPCNSNRPSAPSA